MDNNVGIIYFHGYASSPTSDKVTELRKHFSEVHAFPIDVDPDKSLPYLEDEIDHVFASTINSDKPLIFVGTSLGAWYAGYFAKLYHAPAVLINPCYSFDAVKIDLGISDDIKAKYKKIGFHYPKDTRFCISINDEVIDYMNFPHKAKWTSWHGRSGHRFNGPEFQEVIDYIKTI